MDLRPSRRIFQRVPVQSMNSHSSGTDTCTCRHSNQRVKPHSPGCIYNGKIYDQILSAQSRRFCIQYQHILSVKQGLPRKKCSFLSLNHREQFTYCHILWFMAEPVSHCCIGSCGANLKFFGIFIELFDKCAFIYCIISCHLTSDSPLVPIPVTCNGLFILTSRES